MEKATLFAEANKYRQWFYKGQKYWSLAHHVSIYGSIICSVAAGAVLQFKFHNDSAIATTLTTIAAALTGIATAGGFERKWRSNRLSRSKIDCLLIDIETAGADFKDLSTRLKAIIEKHDQEIIKESPESTPAQAPIPTGDSAEKKQ